MNVSRFIIPGRSTLLQWEMQSPAQLKYHTELQSTVTPRRDRMYVGVSHPTGEGVRGPGFS